MNDLNQQSVDQSGTGEVPEATPKKTWWQRIDQAEQEGGFTSEDIWMAADWVTCACGEQDSRIPRNLGAPEDDVLYHLGGIFAVAVDNHNFAEARETLAAIEKRSAEILAEVTKQ